MPNSTVVSGKVLGTYLDQFGAAAYNNSNGTFAWSSSWTEGGAESGNNASTGLITITGGRLQFRDTGAPRDYSYNPGCESLRRQSCHPELYVQRSRQS